jgi:protein-L-isoaspartate(D-aspartate) O-methyltransferase
VLEIGAGSGYAAAVISRIAARVYAIERHDDLTMSARERLRALGYDNVEIRTGDGTSGWPEAAPFDAIIASAGGPAVPQALKEELDIGGVLVMPVGLPGAQRLMKVRRVSANHFDEHDLGGVSFVPLIGAQAWPDPKLP